MPKPEEIELKFVLVDEDDHTIDVLHTINREMDKIDTSAIEAIDMYRVLSYIGLYVIYVLNNNIDLTASTFVDYVISHPDSRDIFIKYGWRTLKNIAHDIAINSL